MIFFISWCSDMFLILDLQPNAEDQARGLKPGLGATTMAINGAIGLDWTPHVTMYYLPSS